MKERIQKVFSDKGILSRRKTEEYIKAGRITVNGRPAEIGMAVDPAKDNVAIDGENVSLRGKQQRLYIMLNKPRGYVTTTSDELGRKTVMELVADCGANVYPVGRLDRNSEGLIILTNDGALANRIMHPGGAISKTYRVSAAPDITDEQVVRLSTGVDIGEGETSGPCIVEVLEKQPGRVTMRMTVYEGKNRLIRRMCEAVGLEVLRLKRTSIGPVKLGMLPPGKWRELTPQELEMLKGTSAAAARRKPAAGNAARPNAGTASKGTRSKRTGGRQEQQFGDMKGKYGKGNKPR